MPNPMERYLTLAGEQIRWNRARPRLLSELRTHLLDQRDACLAQGMTEEEAQAEAIRQMGDPVLVGQSLDAVHRPRPQWGLMTLTLLLAATGAVLRVWLTAGWETGGHDPVWTITTLCLGCAALLGAYFLDYSWLGRHGKGIFLGVLLLGLLCCYGMRGTSPWGSAFSLAPVAMGYLLMACPLAFGLCLYSCRGQRWKGLCLSLAGLAALSLMAVGCWQAGMVPVLWLVGLALLWVLAGRDWFALGKKTTRAVTLGLLLALGAAAFLALKNDYLATRLSLVLYPEQAPMGAGYSGYVLRHALEGAQWLGEGTWTLTPSYNMALVEGADAFFLTTLLHKLGWLPLVLVVVTLGGLLTWLLVRGLQQKNLLGQITVLAVTASLLLPLVLGLVSSLGFPLWRGGVPLFYTGAGATVDLALLGFALSVLRQEQLPMDDPLPVRRTQTE